MAMKIRLRQHGCTNHIVYRIVVTDSRSPRDGKYNECIGWYNPCAKDEQQICSIEQGRLAYWLSKGAQATETVEALAIKAAPEVILGHKQSRFDRIRKKKASVKAKKNK